MDSWGAIGFCQALCTMFSGCFVDVRPSAGLPVQLNTEYPYLYCTTQSIPELGTGTESLSASSDVTVNREF